MVMHIGDDEQSTLTFFFPFNIVLGLGRNLFFKAEH
jgi:hypothetical protein